LAKRRIVTKSHIGNAVLFCFNDATWSLYKKQVAAQKPIAQQIDVSTEMSQAFDAVDD
jgi:hypothetical protein